MLSVRDLYQQIEQQIQDSHNSRYYVCEGTVTSRSTNPPSVKVMLQPMNIETGWIRVGTPYAGNGYGFLAIPPSGLAVKVIFDLGDINNPTLVCNVYSDLDTPPTLANVDDVALVGKTGSQLYFDSTEGNVTLEATGTLTLKGSTGSQTY